MLKNYKRIIEHLVTLDNIYEKICALIEGATVVKSLDEGLGAHLLICTVPYKSTYFINSFETKLYQYLNNLVDNEDMTDYHVYNMGAVSENNTLLNKYFIDLIFV